MKSWQVESRKKIVEPSEIKTFVKKLRGKKVATLNGAFDLLHAGHLDIIYKASQKADVLIVALNSDHSIKKYKDPRRPIIPLKYRLLSVAAIGFVDYVTYFHEKDPRRLLEKIKPDVHVNGKEYGINCLEKEVVEKYGGKICLVGHSIKLSTSYIIKKIKRCEK